MLPTPNELVAFLKDHVFGQDDAAQDLAVAVYYHYLGIAFSKERDGGGSNLKRDTSAPVDLGKQHILLIGPTGVGKTTMVKQIQAKLSVTCLFVAATQLVRAGIVGVPVDQLVEELWLKAEKDVVNASRGIIFIDELDKVRGSDSADGQEVSGVSVQNALLSLMDGKDVGVPLRDPVTRVNTSNILFVCSGAFTAMTEVIRSRMKDEALRTAVPGRTIEIPSGDFEALRRNTIEDWRSCGFIPELIGRFSVISVLRELDKECMLKILSELPNSIVRRQAALYAMHGIKLTFDAGAIDLIAEKALAERVGARGLDKTVLKLLNHFDADLSQLVDEGVNSITISREFVQWRLEITAADFEPNQVLGYDPVGREARVARLNGFREAAVAGLWSGKGRSDALQPPKSIEDLRERIQFASASVVARVWWERFETENNRAGKLDVVLKLGEEMIRRQVLLTEFHDVYQRSRTQNIQGILHFLDYDRLKRAEEKKQTLDFVELDKLKTASSTPKVNDDDYNDDDQDDGFWDKWLDDNKPVSPKKPDSQSKSAKGNGGKAPSTVEGARSAAGKRKRAGKNG